MKRHFPSLAVIGIEWPQAAPIWGNYRLSLCTPALLRTTPGFS